MIGILIYKNNNNINNNNFTTILIIMLQSSHNIIYLGKRITIENTIDLLYIYIYLNYLIFFVF